MRVVRRPLLLLVLALALTGCSGASLGELVAARTPLSLGTNVEADATGVAVDLLVEVTAEGGDLEEVALVADDEDATTITGVVEPDGWQAQERLEPGTSYLLTASGRGAGGEPATLERSFTTRDLSLDEQTYPSVAPLSGETVGVGMPIIVTFDLPVVEQGLFERNMHVRTDREVEGSWSWFSDRQAHYRPKEFWPAGTEVTVDLQLNSLHAGNGIYGQQDQVVPFTIGKRVVSTVDVAGHTLTLNVDGLDVRTIAVSTGKPGHETRAGTKVVMEKFSSVDMDAATTGVDSSDPDYYDISDVRWAMRVTNSGEFLHAAPWSVGSQGRENVSHGCVGMSTADAAWLYERSSRGDVVRFVGSARALEDRNGWTDWNVPWEKWLEGSALA